LIINAERNGVDRANGQRVLTKYPLQSLDYNFHAQNLEAIVMIDADDRFLIHFARGWLAISCGQLTEAETDGSVKNP